MTVHVFIGPTLAAEDVRREIDAVVSGPASFGDVYRAACARPVAIAIVDGYFENVPAVWHKEILWAMSEGVHVFGASSMGALRAAELADFGMVGIGSVYDAFSSGELEDDDEVAVVHGSEAEGYRPLSDAMVNIRATLKAAVREHIIDPDNASAIVNIAKRDFFYAERTFTAVLRSAAAAGVAPREVDSLRNWLPSGRVDQKAVDARMLLSHLRTWLGTAPPPKRVTYRFEPTDAWHEATRLARAKDSASTSSTVASEAQGVSDALVEELLISGTYPAVRDAAAARAAAIDLARRSGVRPDAIAVRSALEDIRRTFGLGDREALDRWLSAQRIDHAELERFALDEARLAWAKPLVDQAARGAVVDHLRSTADYGRLVTRAEAKAKQRENLGIAQPSLSDVGLDEPALWRWYFEERLGRSLPDNLDVFARAAGFSDKDSMRIAVLRERWYLDRQGD